MATGRPWTYDEISELIKLRHDGLKARQISLMIGRPWASVLTKLKFLGDVKAPHSFLPPKDFTRPNAAAIADMHRRGALEHATTTAALMGDPLPGTSALDRRRG